MTGCGAPPPAGTVKMSKSPVWLLAYAIRSPSGENAGPRLRPPPDVTGPVSAPPAVATWIWFERAKATCIPSGAQEGSRLSAVVVAISGRWSVPVGDIA